MALQIYRIDRSFIGSVGHFFKKPDLPVQAAVSGLICTLGRIAKVYAEVTTDNCYILHEEDEIRRFRNPLGANLLDDVYYIRHPKKSRTDCLIPADQFHSYIVREQIADIISYIRANVQVKRLRVSIDSGVGASVNAKGVFDGLPLEGSVSVKQSSAHEVIIECATPLRASEKRRDFIWLDDFASTVAAIDEVTGGSIEINEDYDLSFGLNAKLAAMISVACSGKMNYRYHVSCELG
jgi:hypothetical protein